MKTYKLLFCLKALCFSLLIGALFISCQSEEPVINQPDMHDRIIGQWEAKGWFSNDKKWTITNDSIYNTVHIYGETKRRFILRYELVNDSVIHLYRCWVSQDAPHYDVLTGINFLNDSTLVINEMVPDISAIYPPHFMPITFIRK